MISKERGNKGMTKREIKYILRHNKKVISADYSLKVNNKFPRNRSYIIRMIGSEYILFWYDQTNSSCYTEIYRSLFLDDVYERLCWLLVPTNRTSFKANYYALT